MYNFRTLKILRQLWLSLDSYFKQAPGIPFSSSSAEGQAQDHSGPCSEVTSNLNFNYHPQNTVYSVLGNKKCLFRSKDGIWVGFFLFVLWLLDSSIAILEYWAMREKKLYTPIFQITFWFVNLLCFIHSFLITLQRNSVTLHPWHKMTNFQHILHFSSSLYFLPTC